MGLVVSIVGLGLMGGSMGMALRRAPGIERVVGVARRADTVAEAVAVGAVDGGTTDLQEGVRGADVVVFATPVRTIADLAAQAAPALAPGTVVTDVGSTKAELCRTLPPLLPPGVEYIGGHPMAGSERTGLEAADPYLYQNAIYILTPLREEQPGLDKAIALVEAVGAHPLILDPEQHDRAVAAVSHLPHMVATALVLAVGEVAAQDPRVLALAAGGFRDTTRVASGDPVMWRDICLSNRGPLLEMMDRFAEALAAARAAVAAGDGDGLMGQMARARAVREQLPRHRKGILSPMSELVVQLEDRPGAIHEVTGCIAAKGINIKDIEILRVREGEGGTLRLAFAHDEDLEKALGELAARGFVARRRG
ncbi:MAG: prephenate dehydrogenase/arogenate dehydrogenase family protein [Limnochordales bacterium]